MIKRYNEKLINSPKVVLDFYAGWCIPCKAITPILGRMSEQYEGIEFLKVDAEQLPELAEKYGVEGLPTIILMRNGKELFRHSGAWDSSSLYAAVNEHLAGEA